MSEHKVCLYIRSSRERSVFGGTMVSIDVAACGYRRASLAPRIRFSIADDIVPAPIFTRLPRVVQCDECAARIRLRGFMGIWPDKASASRADILSVALFCGALAGALDDKLRAVIADYIAHGDPSPLLDLAEQRGLHEGGYGPERYEKWEEATPHEHAWLPWESGDAERTLGVFPGFRDASRFRRCPCGVFEHEDERRRSPLRSSDDDTIEMRARYWGNVVAQPWPRGPFDI